MDLPLEYVILSAVAAVLLVVLICLLCYLFCRRSSNTPEPEAEKTEPQGPKYVEEKKNASIYDPKSVTKVTPKRTKVEATPTQLLDAGYTPTQLLDNDIAREATPNELRDAGYTPSQLQDAGIEKPKKQQKSSAKKDFRSKPLKFDSQRSDPDNDRRGRPTKRRQDWDDDPVPKRRSPADRRRSNSPSDRRRQESGRRSAVNDSDDRRKTSKDKDGGLTQLF